VLEWLVTMLVSMIGLARAALVNSYAT
jgi:hypothetical protein